MSRWSGGEQLVVEVEFDATARGLAGRDEDIGCSVDDFVVVLECCSNKKVLVFMQATCNNWVACFYSQNQISFVDVLVLFLPELLIEIANMRRHMIDGFSALDPATIAAHVAAGERVIVQFGRSGYTDEKLSELNWLAKLHGRSFEIRFYGHYGEVFDGCVLRRLPDAASVSIDSVSHARNLDALSHIQGLQEFRLGIFELDHGDVLDYCNPASMKKLTLGGTRLRNIDLGNLSQFSNLESLHSTGQTKKIAAICDLPNLRNLSLSSFHKKDYIGFVSHLTRLVSLRFILGGRASIAELEAPALERLEILRVRGLEDLGDLARFEGLRDLKVEDQIRLTGIRVAPNPALQNIAILNCKNFRCIDGLHALPALSSLRFYQTAVDYETLIGGPLPTMLEHLAFYTTKSKRDEEIAEDLRRRGFRIDAI